jgi:hypothetical protein
MTPAPYSIAISLKHKGFNELCFYWFQHTSNGDTLEYGFSKNSEAWLKGEHCSAPLYEQVIDWFEKEKKTIVDDSLYYSFNKQKWAIADINHPDRDNDVLSTFFDSKKDALNKLIEDNLTEISDKN